MVDRTYHGGGANQSIYMDDPNFVSTPESEMAKQHQLVVNNPNEGLPELTPEQAAKNAEYSNTNRSDPATYSNTNSKYLGASAYAENSMFDALHQNWMGAEGRQGLQADGRQYTADRWQEMAARQAQQAAMAQWQNAAAGNGPSAAAAQYQNAALGAMSQQAGAMAGARPGMGAAGATRAALFGGAQSMNAAAQQGAATRAQEMQAAMGGYSNASQAMRGQDISRAGQQSQWAMDQARLLDAQKARNDAQDMYFARLYMGNQGRVSDRDSANVWTNEQIKQAAAARDQARSNAESDRLYSAIGTGAKAIGTGLAFL